MAGAALKPEHTMFLTDTAEGLKVAKGIGVNAILMMNDPDEAKRLAMHNRREGSFRCMSCPTSSAWSRRKTSGCRSLLLSVPRKLQRHTRNIRVQLLQDRVARNNVLLTLHRVEFRSGELRQVLPVLIDAGNQRKPENSVGLQFALEVAAFKGDACRRHPSPQAIILSALPFRRSSSLRVVPLPIPLGVLQRHDISLSS